MLSEHTFITTLPPEEALDRLRAALELCGFTVATNAQGELTANRGKPLAQKAIDVTECPLRVSAGFDRGRVTVAAQVQEKSHWDRGLKWTGPPHSPHSQRLPKLKRVYGDVVFAAVAAMERAMTASPESATSDWRAMELAMRAEGARARKVGRLALVGVLVGCPLLIWAVVAATQ